MHRIGEKTRTDEPSSSRAIQKRPAESKAQEVDVKAGRRALNGRAMDGWMDGWDELRCDYIDCKTKKRKESWLWRPDTAILRRARLNKRRSKNQIRSNHTTPPIGFQTPLSDDNPANVFGSCHVISTSKVVD